MTVMFEGVEVKAGDKVKIRLQNESRAGDEMVTYKESPFWLEVREDRGALLAGDEGWFIERSNVTILAHEPAPEKVTVELGKALGDMERPYSDRPTTLVAHVTYGGVGFVIRNGGRDGTWLDDHEARELAKDILATVGPE